MTSTATGLVTFRLGEREYATSLADVREVVRLHGLAGLPGMRPPLAGVLDLRGAALPVLDLRPDGHPARGDVLVLERGAPDDAGPDAAGGPVGVAVDQVRAVLPAGDLPRAGAGADAGVLPAYVVDVLRGADGVVFLVDLEQMVASARVSAPAYT
jgi:purine-binding chemotaxis protein CheW